MPTSYDNSDLPNSATVDIAAYDRSTADDKAKLRRIRLENVGIDASFEFQEVLLDADDPRHSSDKSIYRYVFNIEDSPDRGSRSSDQHSEPCSHGNGDQ